MTALEQVEQLTQQAITILLTERDAIDARLQQLGYGEIKSPKRGRPPKLAKLPQSTIINTKGDEEERMS